MLDIRIPIGLLFTVLGILLTIYGIATNSNAAMYVKSFQSNVNLWSGIGMLVLGSVMLVTARLKKRKNKL